MKYEFTSDIATKNEILKLLKENEKEYGKRYCPCVNPELYDRKYICPCQDFRQNTPIGEECHCGLYIKKG